MGGRRVSARRAMAEEDGWVMVDDFEALFEGDEKEVMMKLGRFVSRIEARFDVDTHEHSTCIEAAEELLAVCNFIDREEEEGLEDEPQEELDLDEVNGSLDSTSPDSGDSAIRYLRADA